MANLAQQHTATQPAPVATGRDEKKILADYDLVTKAIDYLSRNARAQPALDEVAKHVGLSPYHFQRLFTRWAGISPKAFLQTLTIEHARQLLRGSASVLDTALEVGLSGPGRLHDLFVTFEAMSPGTYKSGGAGLQMSYGFHASPFGVCLAIATTRGLAGIGFADNHSAGRQAALADMARRWPRAQMIEAPAVTAPLVATAFAPKHRVDPLNLVFIGTDFDVSVWRTLLKIPTGCFTTYSDIARHIGRPKAARAVGSAVGRNPISFVVPCHRVLRTSGELGGYHWGLVRKQAIIGWEASPALS